MIQLPRGECSNYLRQTLLAILWMDVVSAKISTVLTLRTATSGIVHVDGYILSKENRSEIVTYRV